MPNLTSLLKYWRPAGRVGRCFGIEVEAILGQVFVIMGVREEKLLRLGINWREVVKRKVVIVLR